MLENGDDNLSPKSWGDVKMVVLGDSHVGSLSFKEVPDEDRPRLRARSFKGARLHQLLPMVDSEITGHDPHLVVVSVGHSDLTHSRCMHFKETTHQHRVQCINYEFNIRLAADEIFREWHSLLAKHNCKVIFALTYAMDFHEYNVHKLKHCPECQELYSDGDQRDTLINKIKEWGELLVEKDIPVMYLDEVLKRINPDYMMNDAVIEEEERALIDGLRLNKDFGKHFYTVIREEVEKEWPNFIGGEEENMDNNESNSPSPQPSPSQSTEEQNDVEEQPVLLPLKKKSKHTFRF